MTTPIDSAADYSVYVHIPFCVRACPYCNFNFRLRRNYSAQFVGDYVDALTREYAAWLEKNPFLANIRSLYFGGGTPSLLKPQQISRLVEAFAPKHLPEIEKTLEANPEDCLDHLRAFRQAGINRLSLGVQSMNARKLKALGRKHTPQMVRQVMRQARRAGFENISVDLMGAAPQETAAEFAADLHDFLKLKPEHISYYGLTIEAKTLFGQKYKAGKLNLPAEELQARFFKRVRQTFKGAGYVQYEISNYGLPGFASEHNLGYWRDRNYLGLGAGAHSFLKVLGENARERRRSRNVNAPETYVDLVGRTGQATDESEVLSGRQAMGEFVMVGLRDLAGVSSARFEHEFGQRPQEIFGREIAELEKQKLIRWSKSEKIRLTPKGVLFSDTVFEYFL